MNFSAVRSWRLLWALLLLAGGCVSTSDRTQNPGGRVGDGTATPPSVVAIDPQESPEPTIRPVAYTADTQEQPAGKVTPPTGQTPSEKQAEAIPPPAAVDENAAAKEQARQISLPSALTAVVGQNPQVAYANERISESFAQAQAASVLWLPAIRAGVSYNKHDGTLQAVNGDVSDLSRTAMESGLGMGAVGAGSPVVPGVTANFRMADAIFLPPIAQHIVAARKNASEATVHDLLLSVALGYVDLLRAFQQEAIAEETLGNAQQLADLTAEFARTGQGSQADADRAKAELAVRKNEVLQAQELTAVASARLIELLSLDATSMLMPQESEIVPIELVSGEVPLPQLVAQGISNRPELAESRELVCAAVGRLQRERCAPLIPSVLLGVSYGGFGGGSDSTITDYRGRFDLDAAAYWELRNFGLGERIAQNEARSRLEQAKFRQVQVMDQVAREIVEAHVQVDSRRRQIGVAQTGVEAAIASYRRNLERIRNGKGLPIEVLQSIQALHQSRQEYLRAVSSYDEAQFRLHRALGWPIPKSDLLGTVTAATDSRQD